MKEMRMDCPHYGKMDEGTEEPKPEPEGGDGEGGGVSTPSPEKCG